MKDPAVLFYYQDFLVGTEFMTDDEVGKYIRILCHQADKGVLSESQVKRICRTETIPCAIIEKLSRDEEGNFYQHRMKIEKEKRVKHIEHQRNNANKRWNKDVCHGNATAMPLENENENINEDVNINREEVKKEKKNKHAEFVSLTDAEYNKLCNEHTEQNAKVFISILNNYKGANGKRYKSDYLAILNWVVDKSKKEGKYIGAMGEESFTAKRLREIKELNAR